MPEQNQDRPTVRRVYGLNGLRLSVTAPDEELGTCLDSFLAPLTLESRAAGDWRISIRLNEELPAHHGQVVWQGDLPEGLHGVISRDPSTNVLLVTDHLVVITAPGKRETEVVVRPGREQTLRGTPSISIVAEAIRSVGQFLLHAACLSFPSSDDCLIIFAPSGTGKTTTSLALARAGWRLMGDDVTILNLNAGVPLVWALPRWLTVHRRTEELLPWLTAATKPWDGRDQQAVKLGAVAPLIDLSPPRPRPCRTVVMLDRPNAAAHELGPLERGEAMLRVLSDNLRISPYGLVERDLSFLDAVTRVVNVTQLFWLSVGPDLASLGAFLNAACGEGHGGATAVRNLQVE